MPELVPLLQEYMGLEEYVQKAGGLEDLFVQTKLTVVRQYQADILFYILAKEGNQDLRDHPVIKSLVEKKENLTRVNKIGKAYEKVLF